MFLSPGCRCGTIFLGWQEVEEKQNGVTRSAYKRTTACSPVNKFKG
jgi:hypothetical protein